jgi:hypothetical protein
MRIVASKACSLADIFSVAEDGSTARRAAASRR